MGWTSSPLKNTISRTHYLCSQRFKTLKFENVFLVQIVQQIFPHYRDEVTQTKKDNYSNVPKPQVFLAGLRGGGMSKPTEMNKMDLTIDVDQT